MASDGLPAGLYPPDLEHVPTTAELIKRGLAQEVVHKFRDHSAFKTRAERRVEISPAGQQLIYDAMKRNAERCKVWNARRLVNAAIDAAVV